MKTSRKLLKRCSQQDCDTNDYAFYYSYMSHFVATCIFILSFIVFCLFLVCFTNNMRNIRTEHEPWIGNVLFMNNKRDA